MKLVLSINQEKKKKNLEDKIYTLRKKLDSLESRESSLSLDEKIYNCKYKIASLSVDYDNLIGQRTFVFSVPTDKLYDYFNGKYEIPEETLEKLKKKTGFTNASGKLATFNNIPKYSKKTYNTVEKK